MQKHRADLDKLFRKAFEQLALESLSEAQFSTLTGSCKVRKQGFTGRSGKQGQEISAVQDKMVSTDHRMAIADRYTKITS